MDSSHYFQPHLIAIEEITSGQLDDEKPFYPSLDPAIGKRLKKT